MVAKWYSLYSLSIQQITVAQYMCCFFQTSYPPVFFFVNYFNLIPRRQMVSPFPSICGQPYPTFQPFHEILPFDVLLALLLVGGMFHLCILYHNCMGRNTCNSWSCFTLLGAWLMLLLNIILISYRVCIFWIFLARSLT